MAADSTRHASHVSDSVAAWAVAVPAAIYLSVVALLHAQADAAWTFPSWLPFVTAVALLLLPLLTTVVPLAVVVVLMGLLVVSLVAVSIVARHRTAVRAAARPLRVGQAAISAAGLSTIIWRRSLAATPAWDRFSPKARSSSAGTGIARVPVLDEITT